MESSLSENHKLVLERHVIVLLPLNSLILSLKIVWPKKRLTKEGDGIPPCLTATLIQ